MPEVITPGEDLVSVLIPARNEEADLAGCLDSVLAQDYPNLQVIVVDGASEDRTQGVIREYMARDSRVELLVNPEATIPVSLNLGLDAAKGTWLVRVDAHSTIPAGYVRRAVERLQEGIWGGVGGQKAGRGESAQGRAIAAALGSRFGVGNSTYHYATEEHQTDHLPFGAYSVEMVRDLGGWTESLVANEDFEFDLRVREAGMSLLFDPKLRIDWKSRQTVAALWCQYHRYGRSKVPVVRLHPSSIRLRHLAPPALVAYLTGALATCPRHPRVGASLVALYVLGVLVASKMTGKDLSMKERKFLPLAFGAMHLGWGLGFWRGVGAALVEAPGRTR